MSPSEKPTLHERVISLENCTNELAVVIVGTPRPLIAGGGRNSDGLVHKVETLQVGQIRIEAILRNGGMTTHLTGAQRTALWSAAVGGMAAIIVAIIGVAT